MSMFEVGDLAVTQNSVWLANNGLVVQVVAVNARTQTGQTSPYAIRRIDEHAFEATLQVTTGIPHFLTAGVIGCAVHQLRQGTLEEVRAAFTKIVADKAAAEKVAEPASQS
ncbi:hypothetical protein [Sulfuritalea sp.]|uniref:hypothetical protein n=1 Tax=Sulfuritalea sp. TaxID=2480090 RepID=UPI001AC0B3BF|nr:hypothetical protein [Sulfuritalea sp.]MBN8474511.1 hypothetical protein [Sulfuritalea sp.]